MPVVETPAKTIFSPFPTILGHFSRGPDLAIRATNQGLHRFRASSAPLENGEKRLPYFSVI
jgi:hypothetical protein